MRIYVGRYTLCVIFVQLKHTHITRFQTDTSYFSLEVDKSSDINWLKNINMDANPHTFQSIVLANWIHLKYVFQTILIN